MNCTTNDDIVVILCFSNHSPERSPGPLESDSDIFVCIGDRNITVQYRPLTL